MTLFKEGGDDKPQYLNISITGTGIYDVSVPVYMGTVTEKLGL